jgi:CRP/FNR family transcriptional regulator, cyclic AMP receptor protein
MQSPYGLEIIESCEACKLRDNKYFCDLAPDSLREFEALKYSTVFPKGAILFVEGQSPRGVFMLCAGRVKLSTCSSDGKSIITEIAEAGELLGLSAVISARPYEVTAETLVPCQVNFIKRDDILRFLSLHGTACMRAAEQMSNAYHQSYNQVRSLGLSNSSAGKLANLILEWCAKSGKQTERGIVIKLTLTHEEMAQLIGASRETVTRLLSEFKSKQFVYVKGSNLIIRNKAALEGLVNS